MSTFPTFHQAVAPTTNSRSLGGKFFLILLLALGMSISGFFVDSLTTDRADKHGVLSAMRGDSSGSNAQPTKVLGIRLVDSYRATERSVHYMPLFLGLVFLTYFLFEVSSTRHVHPAQYALVGVAQIIFYLLLLSFAEHLGFDLSFLIAGASTIALFSINTEWIFRSRKLAFRALTVFSVLYAFIYVLLRVEAYALLVGAIASFVAVAAAMFATRNVDWYGTGARTPSFAAGAAGASPRESWLD